MSDFPFDSALRPKTESELEAEAKRIEALSRAKRQKELDEARQNGFNDGYAAGLRESRVTRSERYDEGYAAGLLDNSKHWEKIKLRVGVAGLLAAACVAFAVRATYRVNELRIVENMAYQQAIQELTDEVNAAYTRGAQSMRLSYEGVRLQREEDFIDLLSAPIKVTPFPVVNSQRKEYWQGVEDTIFILRRQTTNCYLAARTNPDLLAYKICSHDAKVTDALEQSVEK